TWHGELIEVYGTGILIIGDSGIGKSETAVEMLKRGHRLVADDAVELRRVSEISIVGSAPENTRYFMELRGIGIVNVRQLFGMGAVKVSEKVDLIIKLEPWDSDKSYTNFGGGEETMDILGIKIPMITVPVKPGRNLAVILEVAAMNHRDRQMGYNAEQELLSSLGLTM
ncbi:MAG: HPr kinase/phosphorylase, partial [Oscillospiraceae bacterium]|nr:HPr kinase/phosphorylase [Oscillospiraceae bacterium]